MCHTRSTEDNGAQDNVNYDVLAEKVLEGTNIRKQPRDRCYDTLAKNVASILPLS